MFGSNYLLGQVSQSILAELRRQIFHRMLHWPAETYQTNSTGLVTSKFVFEANFGSAMQPSLRSLWCGTAFRSLRSQLFFSGTTGSLP
ncbi:MAG: ABC transporter transmembrane domain-containing protein [Sutterella wadsworthensis]